MKKKNAEAYRLAYGCGLVGLVTMAVVELLMALEVVRMTEDAWEYSAFLSFGVVVLGWWFWLILGIFCLWGIRKAPREYKADLWVMGLLDIFGIGGVALGPLLYKLMVVAWLVYYGGVFGWLIYREVKRRGGRTVDSRERNPGGN